MTLMYMIQSCLKRLHVPGVYAEAEPMEVQSTDKSLCEEDVFARPELCPAVCPYAAEMRDEFCHFRCVKKEECGLLGTVENATIPDDRRGWRLLSWNYVYLFIYFLIDSFIYVFT